MLGKQISGRHALHSTSLTADLIARASSLYNIRIQTYQYNLILSIFYPAINEKNELRIYINGKIAPSFRKSSEAIGNILLYISTPNRCFMS
jgi:hypothetical protein